MKIAMAFSLLFPYYNYQSKSLSLNFQHFVHFNFSVKNMEEEKGVGESGVKGV